MKRRMAQPLFVLSVAATLVLTLSVVVLSAQFQPIVPDIGFEIEGNTALDFGGDYFDWENTEFPPAERIPDPNSRFETDDDIFKPNSKFDDPAGWSIMPGKVGPGQSELVNFLHWDIQPGSLGGGRPNDHWLVLGMERIKTPGFFELDFEYNQVAWDGSSGGLTRTPGDVLVGFELRGKPTSKRAENKVLLLQYWPDAQPSLCSTTRGPGGEPELVEVGTDPCPLYSDSGWYYRLLADDALSAESGLVQATMNKEPFSPSWPAIDSSGQPCDVIGPYQFAEAAINLTALGIGPSCGSAHAKTRSAPHVQSDLKDLVGPVTPECARLDGHKFEDTSGDGVWDPDELPLEGWEIRLSDGSVTHTDAEGYYAFEDLAYGTYTVSEVCPQGEGWIQTAPTPDVPNSCGLAVYEVELDSGNPEVNDLDFGNRFGGPPPLYVEKDVQTSYTRTYEWTLVKTVDDSGPILLYPGDYAEVNYEVKAASTPVDNWTVEGTITIKNEGGTVVALDSVTDVISPGDITVPVDCDRWILQPLETATCIYGPISLPDGSERTNTVTVTVAGSSKEWTATDDIVFDPDPTEIDEMARITDTNWEDEQWFDVEASDIGWEESYPWKIDSTGWCTLFDVPNTATLTTNDTGTVLTADENVQILEVCEVTIAYEDLRYPEEPETEPGEDPERNDWDYNDLLVHIPIFLTVSKVDGVLEAVSFEVTQEPVQTAFAHTVNLTPTFTCGGDYIKKVTDMDGETITDGEYKPGDSLELIANTWHPPLLPEPPESPTPEEYEEYGEYLDDVFLVELRIDFDEPAPGEDCQPDFGDPDPENQYHGQWLFFNPGITVYRHDLNPPMTYDINVRWSLDDPEPRILTVPFDWIAPDNYQGIWNFYDCVLEGLDAGDPPIFHSYWWDDNLCQLPVE